MQAAAFRAIGAYRLIVGVPDLLELCAGYLNTTDEEMRRALNGVWERRRQLRLETTSNEGTNCQSFVSRRHRSRKRQLQICGIPQENLVRPA